MQALKFCSLLAIGGMAALSTASAFAAHPAAFTIEEVMQAPYPSSLIAASKGDSVAWVFDTKGCRNVWLSQGGHAHAITNYTLDDGFDVGDLALAPDASAVYVAGDFNTWGENKDGAVSKSEAAMTKGEGGVWEKEMTVTPGPHSYKFVVDGNRWENDPNAPEKDAQGNSVIEVK